MSKDGHNSSAADNGDAARTADTNPNRITGDTARRIAREFGINTERSIPPVLGIGDADDSRSETIAVGNGATDVGRNQVEPERIESDNHSSGNRARNTRRITVKPSGSDGRTDSSATEETQVSSETPIPVEIPKTAFNTVGLGNESKQKPTSKKKSETPDKSSTTIGTDLIADIFKAIFAIPSYAGLGDYWQLSESEASDLERAVKKALKTLPKGIEKKVFNITEKWSPILALVIIAYGIISPRLSRYETDRREKSKARGGLSQGQNRSDSRADASATQAAFDAFTAKSEKYPM